MNNYQKYRHVSNTYIDWGFYISTVGYCKTEKNMHYPAVSEHPTDHVFSWNKGADS